KKFFPFHRILNGTRQFVIPVFQRDYRWEIEQCDRFWRDIIAIARDEQRSGHFLGSVVYVSTEDSSAGFVRWQLIDGQQRMTTLTLLLAVDEIVAELDDFSLHVVRARLADEMIALKQVPSDSSQNIYLRLEALKSEIASLYPVLPEYQQAIGVPEAALTVWEQIAAATKDLVRVRTLTEGATVRPLIAPEEEAFLHQHLQLALSQAQLAALKRQQAVYELALTRVREYLVNYMDLRAREALLAELDALSLLALERTLPDISGSLNELLSTMGNQ
ncbi:MAG: uroporphyrinogen-III C-methyltransferase, partial [Pseudomonadales bacterium]|nr:uroporphyrinogen-III C-methyltransferase [Pseudomonadales bacterium]